MATIPMVQPVTLETAQHYAVNAGMMVTDVDISKVTDAETFLTAVKADTAVWLGATSGTTNISEGRQVWNPDHNGLRMPWVNSEFLDTAKPSIKAKLVEMKHSNLALASGAADVEGQGTNVTKIKPRANYKPTDYKNVIWFTNLGTEGIIAVVLKNALCTTGIAWTIDDKKVATCDVEFIAHVANATEADYLPIEYLLFKSIATA